MEEEISPEKKNNKPKLFIGAAVLLGLACYGISIYLNSRHYESTDNAQLDSDVLPIRAGISGYLSDVRFKDNQEIRKGDTLLVFSTAELKAEVARISAELSNADLNVAISEGTAQASRQNAAAAQYDTESDAQAIQAAKATYERSLSELNRGGKLLEIKAITQTAYEQLQTMADVNKAAYLKAQALRRSSTGNVTQLNTRALTQGKQIGVARNLILEKRAELDAAKERLGHAFVIAPFDGIVTKRNVQAGQYITAGQSLCALINHKDLWVTANFKETQLNKIKPGQQVTISVDAFEGTKLTGTIESLSGATGARFALLPPDNATGNFIKIAQRFPVRIRLDKYAGGEKLYPGLSAFVKVKVD